MLQQELMVLGQYVAYTGEDVPVREEPPRPGRPSTLYHGHPGRITDPMQEHIIADWVGIEDTPFSWANGFSVTYRGGPCPGLAPLTEQEYELRKDRIARGLHPFTGANAVEGSPGQ